MYAIVDIETTGGSAKNDRITEIAVYVHDGVCVVDEFTTLVNPERHIPAFITRMTGISDEMVADAPRFYEIARRIIELTENRIFVAHNVSFDYSFLQREFQALGYDFHRKRLCTVQLSRKLIPGLASYSLGNVCHDLDIQIYDRHRAAGDALATVKLFERLLAADDSRKPVFRAISESRQRFSNLLTDKKLIDNLPPQTGVYYLYNEAGEVIYVGKSKNIHQRVIEHFRNDTTAKALEMAAKIADVGYELTGSELVALLLESEEIKKLGPVYNRAQRRSRSQYAVYHTFDSKGYLCFEAAKLQGRDESPLATFSSLEAAKARLSSLVQKYGLCQRLSSLHASSGACFGYHIKECNGACVGDELPETYNLRAEAALLRLRLPHASFIVTDRGRNASEQAVVGVRNGKYLGYGYIDTTQAVFSTEELYECIRPREDNSDVHRIIRQYLENHRVEKLFVIDE